MVRISGAVKHLLIANIIVFFASFYLYPVLLDLWPLWFVQNPNFDYWQILTHMFMHGGFAHILFNMYALWAFGSPLEQIWGKWKFVFFYFSAGLGSAMLYTLSNYYLFNSGVDALSNYGVGLADITALLDTNKLDTQWYEWIGKDRVDRMAQAYFSRAVGASGAIYGILVAFAFMYSEARLMLIFLPVPIKAKYFVPALIALDLFFGVSGINTGIAHFAHLGGALIGFIMMWYWKKNQFNDKRWN